MLIDVHCHVTPKAFPESPTQAARDKWPCMQCASNVEATLLIGEKPFRALDNRSWDVGRRTDDMDRDGVSMQVLSPMPELLSYWLDLDAAQVVCTHSNAQIAEMIAAAPSRFMGLGAVPLQDPEAAAEMLPQLRDDFGLDGVEIGSNIDGKMLGDACFDPFWRAAEDLGMAVFVHALHPVAVKPISASPLYTAFAGFPIDVAMAAASLMTSGTLTRFPGLRIGFSHGGGALGSILGRLDKGWHAANRYGVDDMMKPSEQAQRLYYDSNVYDPVYLRHLITEIAPGQVFAGTDYPYAIMQEGLPEFFASAGLDEGASASLYSGAAKRFLGC